MPTDLLNHSNKLRETVKTNANESPVMSLLLHKTKLILLYSWPTGSYHSYKLFMQDGHKFY